MADLGVEKVISTYFRVLLSKIEFVCLLSEIEFVCLRIAGLGQWCTLPDIIRGKAIVSFESIVCIVFKKGLCSGQCCSDCTLSTHPPPLISALFCCLLGYTHTCKSFDRGPTISRNFHQCIVILIQSSVIYLINGAIKHFVSLCR